MFHNIHIVEYIESELRVVSTGPSDGRVIIFSIHSLAVLMRILAFIESGGVVPFINPNITETWFIIGLRSLQCCYSQHLAAICKK